MPAAHETMPLPVSCAIETMQEGDSGQTARVKSHYQEEIQYTAYPACS